MKLNNRGFGLREEIITICIMLILLLFVAVQISNIYKNMEKESKENNTIITPAQEEEVKPKVEEVDTVYYASLENRIKNATLDYVKENDVALTENIIVIYSDTLINNGYLSTLYDQFGSSKCSSISNVYQDESGEINVTVYLNCSNYNTKTG